MFGKKKKEKKQAIDALCEELGRDLTGREVLWIARAKIEEIKGLTYARQEEYLQELFKESVLRTAIMQGAIAMAAHGIDSEKFIKEEYKKYGLKGF